MKKTKTEPVKTMLVIAVGCSIIYALTSLNWALYVSIIIGLIGVFSSTLSSWIDTLWMKLAWVLSLIVPNILLGIVYYVFLFPMSLISKIFRKDDVLQLKNKSISTYKNSEKKFDKHSFENPW